MVHLWFMDNEWIAYARYGWRNFSFDLRFRIPFPWLRIWMSGLWSAHHMCRVFFDLPQLVHWTKRSWSRHLFCRFLFFFFPISASRRVVCLVLRSGKKARWQLCDFGSKPSVPTSLSHIHCISSGPEILLVSIFIDLRLSSYRVWEQCFGLASVFRVDNGHVLYYGQGLNGLNNAFRINLGYLAPHTTT